MKSSEFTSLPNKFTWVLESALLRGRRDPLLRNIDSLVGAAHAVADRSERAHFYFQLYFALNYWLQHFKANTALLDEREPAIRFLFRFVVRELSAVFNCGVQALPNKIENHFGRKLTAHGARLDGAGLAFYPGQAKLGSSKLLFNFAERKFCKLYYGKMKFVNSLELWNNDRNQAELKHGFANFVLTMGGEIYMAAHQYYSTSKKIFFHSSYNSGQAVMCAGSIKVENGVLKAIQNNSGHYQPTDSYIVNLLKHLEMLGHPVTDDIEIYSYGGTALTGGKVFLAANGSWENVIARKQMRAENRQARQAADQTAAAAWKNLRSGTPLRTLVEQRYRNRAHPQMTWAQIWDEVILDLIIGGGDLRVLHEHPAPQRRAPPPPVPTHRPWR